MLGNTNGTLAKADGEDGYGPYMNKDGFCHYWPKHDPPLDTNPWTHKTVKAGVKLQSCTHTTKQALNGTATVIPVDESLLALNVALMKEGPLRISIDAAEDSRDFYFYTSGYYYNPDCYAGPLSLDHTVLAV